MRTPTEHFFRATRFEPGVLETPINLQTALDCLRDGSELKARAYSSAIFTPTFEDGRDDKGTATFHFSTEALNIRVRSITSAEDHSGAFVLVGIVHEITYEGDEPPRSWEYTFAIRGGENTTFTRREIADGE
ncbi:hypothetical protein GCM10025867_50300 (plasmid) [Frondihabitans sucicola]|uniref:DUF4440 domain-containing protein n=1 Tax=Frondihabitans sucicola TaxID=1268041 RepID=A0ABM8GWE8_9MICO|nr:hypothetical protein [Frondihabitans sucicola]BDZ52789.1 hypothetical protein GCM10025867_50300 [Frondihabitans sucicola]